MTLQPANQTALPAQELTKRLSWTPTRVIPVCFASLAAPLSISLGALFGTQRWNWLGGIDAGKGGFATGALIALAIAAIFVVLIGYRYRSKLNVGAITSVWLGLHITAFISLGTLFGTQRWNWLGGTDAFEGGFATGALIALAIGASTTVSIGYRYRSEMTAGALIALWFGCQITAIYPLGELFDTQHWNWVGANNPGLGGTATGVLIALAIGASTAVSIGYRYRSVLPVGGLIALWFGCQIAAFFAMGLLFSSKQWDWVGGNDPNDGGYNTGILISFALTLNFLALSAAFLYRAKMRLIIRLIIVKILLLDSIVVVWALAFTSSRPTSPPPVPQSAPMPTPSTPTETAPAARQKRPTKQ